MKLLTAPVFRGALLAGLALTAASGWAQLPAEIRPEVTERTSPAEAPLAVSGSDVTYKVKRATLVCDGTTPFKSAQKVRLHYETYHPINPNVVLKLVTNPSGVPVVGGSWPLPAGNVAQPVFISPAMTLPAGQNVTVQTWRNSAQVSSPLHNKVVVAPDCGPKLQPGGFDVKPEIAMPKSK